MDHEGNLSPQQDIVIMDQELHPPIFKTLIDGVHPLDSVVATIEVKTKLDKSKLGDAVDNIRKTREELSIILSERKHMIAGGGSYQITSKEIIPEHVAVIFGYESTSMDSMIESIIDLHEETSISNKNRFDLLYIMDTGSIIGWQPSGVQNWFMYRPVEDPKDELELKPVYAKMAREKSVASKTNDPMPTVNAFIHFMRLLNKMMGKVELPCLDHLLLEYTPRTEFEMKSWSDEA
jgi:hypothetical protein